MNRLEYILRSAALSLSLFAGCARSQDLYTNTKIAFTSFRDGNGEIYVMNPDGSEKRRLTNNPANDRSPSWSPNGKKIAFDSTRDGNRDIYVMNVDGSEQKRLTNSPANDGSPSWSPFLKEKKK